MPATATVAADAHDRGDVAFAARPGERDRRGDRGEDDDRDGDSGVFAAYRALRTSVLYGDPNLIGGSLLVTSASPGEGKTTIAANLSVSLARGGARVVVVDCDLRHPALHQQFGIDAAVGLSSVLTASTPVRRAVRTVEAGGTSVDVLLAGPRLTDPADLLVRPEVAELLEQLKADYDHVVLDGPAIQRGPGRRPGRPLARDGIRGSARGACAPGRHRGRDHRAPRHGRRAVGLG